MNTVLDAFLHRLAWYCEAADLSLDRLLIYLKHRVDEEDEWKCFPHALIIDTEIQRQAEGALCELVAMIPQRGNITACWSHSPGHTVDWAATYLEAASGFRGRYRNLDKVPGPDTHLLEGLSDLASRWRQVLEFMPEAEGSQARINRLKAAGEVLPQQQAAWNQAFARKLQRVDAGVADMIEAAILQWDGPGNRGKALAESFSSWLVSAHRQRGGLNAVNNDNLFEWLIPLEIAYTATYSPEMNTARWRLEAPESGKYCGRKYDDITLRRDDELVLNISKGKPRGKCGKETHDCVTRAVRSAGNIDATGLQPDIVLSFFRESEPECTVTYIADAKRNEANQGKSYISMPIQKAAVYIYAYAECLSNKPRCTLFFWQGIEPEYVRDALAGTELPDILCLDYQSITSGGRLMSTWLERLADDASNTIKQHAKICS